MKVKFFISGMICLALCATQAQAQPAPAPEIPAQAAPAHEIPAQALSDNATDATSQSPEDAKAAQSRMLAAQMLEFFDGLDKAVSEKSGDCQAVSDTLRDYCAERQQWIDSLDYASADIDAQTVDAIHAKAIELGKKLSACYDQKSIPELLKRFAKR
ncbi:MAG: hypothetical protein IJ268_14655 [Proteobacteria bacterium]|nr:hypothetical protein [Pseudomonadota bacterium]